MTRKGLLFASTMLMAGAAWAQPPADPADPAPAAPAGSAAPAAPAGGGLDEIIVTAQRRSQRLQDVPLTVVAVSSQQLRQAGVTTLRDLPNIVSGFTFGGQGTVAQPSVRGVSTLLSAAGSENPIALYVDGIYQATQAVLGNELPDIDHIEVLKGPQGTLFGRNATGGAIQLFTRDPGFEPRADITLEQGFYTGAGSSHSSPRTNVRAFASVPLAPDLLAVSVSGGYSYTKGFWTNDATGRQDGEISKGNARAKLLITPADNTRIVLSAFYVRNGGKGELFNTPYRGLSAAGAYPGSVVPTQRWHVAYDTGSGDVMRNVLRQHGFSGRIEQTFDFGTLTSLTGYNKTFTSNPNTSIHFAQATLPCLFNFACLDYDFTIRTREVSQEVNFSSRDFGIFSVVAGAYFYDAKGTTLGFVQGTLASVAPANFPVPVQQTSFHTTAYAGYTEVTAKPAEQLTLIGGLRVSREPHKDQSFIPASPQIKRTFNSTTPRATIKFDVTSTLNVYATYSIGYKSGLTGATNVASNPQFSPVQPEKLKSYEAGVKFATAGLSANLSGFYYDYRNKQEQTFLGTSSVIKNTGPVRIYGIDFDARARITDAFSVNGSVSYIPVAKYRRFPDASGQSTVRIPFDPTRPPFFCAPGGGCGGYYPGVGNVVSPTFDATGLRLTRAPKVSARLTAVYQQDAFDASVTGSYSSKVLQDITQTIVQPRYGTLAAQAGYKVRPNLRLGIFGRNLTNKGYITNALTSASGFAVGFAPPRELGLSVGFTY